MDSDSIPLLVVILFLILLSAFFSACEMSFTSVNRIKLKNLSSEGNKRAALAIRMLDEYDRLLSSILIGNNIVNILATSLSGVMFAMWIKNNPGLAVTASTVAVTLTILLFAEITPKTLTKDNPERFVLTFSPILNFFIIILFPINILFKFWKLLLTKMFKIKKSAGFTEQELITIVEEAGEGGNLNDDETLLIRSAIEFNDVDVGDILVPRVDMLAIDKNLPMEEIRGKFLEHEFSRLPVYDGEIDKVIGMIHEKDFYTEYFGGKDNIHAVIQKVFIATPHMKISNLLKMLQKEKVHLAIVTDEYGGTLGMVTLEDILEELVGEIWDEHDEVIEYFKENGENSFIVDCRAELEDLFELFGLEFKSDEFETLTVGGWVTEEMEIIPDIGDSFTYKQLFIEITRTDSRRVLEVCVTRVAAEEGDKDKDKDKESE